MTYVGVWMRPEFYPVAGKSRAACILDEARNVRQNVGLIDLSTLGKIFVSGPDAQKLLDRVYASRITKLKVGHMAYAIACDESGVLAEEGLVMRIAEERYYLTASTTGGDIFSRELQRWAIIWGLNVAISNATGHWAALNVAGPKARDVLAAADRS